MQEGRGEGRPATGRLAERTISVVMTRREQEAFAELASKLDMSVTSCARHAMRQAMAYHGIELSDPSDGRGSGDGAKSRA